MITAPAFDPSQPYVPVSAPPAPAQSAMPPAFDPSQPFDVVAKGPAIDPNDAPGIAEGVVRAAAKGIPILGGAVNKLEAATNAALAPVIDPLLPDSYDKLPEPTFSGRYQHALDLQNAKDQSFETAHPIADTAAQLAGGVASTLPVASTALGARLLGLTGSTLPGMVARGAAAGAGLNAADAEVRGDDPENAAAVGAITGAAAPVAGRLLGGVVQGARNLIKGPNAAAVPSNLTSLAGVDVPLSSGQATGDQATQMMEQGALRGADGQPAQKVADQFFNGEQAPAVDQARENIQRGLDPQGAASPTDPRTMQIRANIEQLLDQQGITDPAKRAAILQGAAPVSAAPLAADPNEAAQMVSDSVKNIAAASKQNYQALYNDALSRPGEFHAATFEGIGQKIKGDLSLSQNPVIIDDVTTPIASRAIQDIDNQISQLKIQNRADPFGPPNPANVTGVDLPGVDQVRKRLVTFAQATDPGSADRRAVGRIIGSFDDHVEDAMSNGLFTGDDTALDAIKDARAAYAQHQQTFKSQGAGDDVGRAMEKITGRNGTEGATPTEVANYLYGSAKVGGTGLSVRLAQRMQNVLGADSPEWSAIRQGLWSRLSAATEGTTDFGPQKSANRISEFLNGSGKPLAQVMFSGPERDLMGRYAGLQRQITPKPGTVNYSNTAPVLRMILSNTGRNLAALLGDVAGGPAGAVAAYGTSAAAKAMTERSAAGRVARSLYNSPAQNAANATFANQMARYGAVASRSFAGSENQQAVNQ
jgi:hypothetical protein